MLATGFLRLCACIVLLSTVAAHAGSGRLPPSVDREFAAAGIPPAAVSILVQGVDARRPALAVNADRPMQPGSLMKLLTTYAGLELLGPGYRWRTEAFADAPLSDGILAGDLFLRGGGDPHLTVERFWLLLRHLRMRGIREITGDLVLDRSAFEVPAEELLPLDDQPLRPYNVGPDSLLVNFKALQLALQPDPERGTVAVVPEFRPDRLAIDNRIALGTGECTDWMEKLHAEQERTATGYRVTLTGTYPAACGERPWALGVLQHDEFAAELFRGLWAELGGRFAGSIRNGLVPPNIRMLADIESPPLGQVVRDINKFSNNVMARQLYLTLGLEDGHRPANIANSQAAIRAWLARKGLEFPGLVLDNGAGLSRRERISARDLHRLLHDAWTSPVMPELVASLPIVAVDGTMKTRLAGNGVGGQAHIKTGTLDGVKSIAGFVKSRSGRYYIVVCMVNHTSAAGALAAQDALLEWVFRLQ